MHQTRALVVAAGHCYQYPAWPEGLKGSGDQVEMGFGHSVRIEATKDYIERHMGVKHLSKTKTETKKPATQPSSRTASNDGLTMTEQHGATPAAN